MTSVSLCTELCSVPPLDLQIAICVQVCSAGPTTPAGITNFPLAVAHY